MISIVKSGDVKGMIAGNATLFIYRENRAPRIRSGCITALRQLLFQEPRRVHVEQVYQDKLLKS